MTTSLKIGQEIIITEPFKIESCFGDKIQVNEGDKGFVDSRSSIHYITGAARGKMQRIEDAQIKGYDTENIAKLIYKRLKVVFNLGEFLDGYEISVKDFTDEIEDILQDIL